MSCFVRVIQFIYLKIKHFPQNWGLITPFVSPLYCEQVVVLLADNPGWILCKSWYALNCYKCKSEINYNR